MKENDVRSHREQGVPLEGPFLGHFSQGILGEMNEKTHFSDFRIFHHFDLATPGFERPLKWFPKEAIQRLIQLRTGSFQTK